MADDPFFARPSVHAFMAEFGVPRDWIIYVGLGATVDRTGLSWAKLVDMLLRDYVPDSNTRDMILQQHGEVRAATIAEAMYRNKFRATATARIQEDIRQALYQSHTFMNGRLLEAIAVFSVELALGGNHVALVTPNYDDYLYRELQGAIDAVPGDLSARIPTLSRYLVDDVDTFKTQWAEDTSLLRCVYLHGYIPEEGECVGTPIVGEEDYANTFDRSTKVLRMLFDQNDIMLVGTSVTDAPLVNALLETKPEAGGSHGPTRVAILPLQDRQWLHMPESAVSKLAGFDAMRLRVLGVRVIRPDFYIQASPLLFELQRCVNWKDAATMTELISPRRYGTRLGDWWRLWFVKNCSSPDGQAAHHELLRRSCERIHSLIDAPR